MKPFPLLFCTITFAAPFVAAPAVLASEAKGGTPSQPVQVSRSWVQLRAAVEQTTYSSGEPIKIRLTATNTARQGAYLRFSSGQRFNFSLVSLKTGEEAYTWSASRMFMQALGSLWLKPGQSQIYEATMENEMGPLPVGKYELRARLTNTGSLIQASPVIIEVTGAAKPATTP